MNTRSWRLCKNCGCRIVRTHHGWVHTDPDEPRKLWDYGWASCSGGESYAEPKPTRKEQRKAQLLPNGVPRYARCYDNGGVTVDRYTVVFSGNYKGRDGCDYLDMSAHPFYPQGVGLHGWDQKPIDDRGGGWTTPIGRGFGTLGLRIAFTDLPPDCQKLVLRDYKELWNL